MENKNTYRVFAFSEDVISIYNESNKSIDCIENNGVYFDTAILNLFRDKSLEITYFKNGVYVCRSNVIQYGLYPKFLFPIELAGTTQSEVKQEITFCVGDKVFDWKYGWMIVNQIKSHGSIVLVDANHKEHTFSNGESLRLSFTEYNFVTGGWSQERPPKIGSFGWFWDSNEDIKRKCCSYGMLIDINEKELAKYSLDGDFFINFSTENPFEK